ncbi:Imm21 family immunity protein [Streptomyces sp. NPDC059544]|uniref:Imm21 family immunity protein n=1 Tax=Streptomyces sp. NPDC059544 TaxID=3346861 RepID=UPI00369C3A22
MGGPLIVIPISALEEWGGCTEASMVLGDSGDRDDYDRACAVDDLAAVITIGAVGARALVLGDEPATTTCQNDGSSCAGLLPSRMPSCSLLPRRCCVIRRRCGRTAESGKRTVRRC